jgi:hypothetical protein
MATKKAAETEVYLDADAQERLKTEVEEFCNIAAQKRRAKDIAWTIARRMVGGDQWIRANPDSNATDNLVQNVALPGRMEKWKIVANRLISGMDTRLAHVLKNKPIGVVVPETQDEEDRNSARIGDEVVEYDFRTLDYQRKQAERAGPECFTTGNVFWHWYWDPLAGPEIELVKYAVGEDGQPIIMPVEIDGPPDPMTGAPTKVPNPDPLAGKPIEVERKPVPRGEPALEMVRSDELFLDPVAQDFDDCQMVVRQSLRPIDETRNFMQLAGIDQEKIDKIDKVDVNDRAGASTVASARLLGYSAGELASRCEVRVVWAKPNKFKGWPNGLRAVFVNRELLMAEPTPKGSDPIPFAQQIERPLPGDIYGSSSVLQAIPLQKALNLTISRDEYRRTVQRPKPVADYEAGLDENAWTNEDSELLQKNHGYTVEWLAPPTYESDARATDRYLALIDDIFGNVAILMGESDGEIRSGRQAFIQGEYAGTALSGPARSIEQCVKKIGAGLLRLRKANTTEERDIQIVGKNRGIEILQFRGSDLAGAGDYYVEPGSALPMSLAQKKQMIFEMVDRKMLDPARALRLLPVPSDLDAEMDDQRLDRDRATEENLMFTGLDEAAAVDAMDAAAAKAQAQADVSVLEGGGQPPDPTDDLKDVLEQVGLDARPDFENNDVHLDVHNKFRKTAQYRKLPKVVRSLMDFHCAMHLPDVQPMMDGGMGGGPGGGGGGDQGDALPQGLMPGMPPRVGNAGELADMNGDAAGGMPTMPPTPSGGIQS